MTIFRAKTFIRSKQIKATQTFDSTQLCQYVCLFFSLLWSINTIPCWEGIYYLCFTALKIISFWADSIIRPKNIYVCFRFQLWKKLSMVGRHNVLFCQNISYRNCIFQQIWQHFANGPDSSVGRVSAPGNGRSWVRSRDKVFKSGTSCSSLATQIYGVELVGLVDPVSG